MNTAFFILAMLIPWLLGYSIVKTFLYRRNGCQAFAIGSGYILGWFIASLILRLYDYTDRPFDITEIVLIECFLVLPLLLLQIKKYPIAMVRSEERVSKVTYFLSVLIVLLLVYRYGLTAVDLFSKPVFPWDGWLSWSAKAKVFYYAQKIPLLYGYEMSFWRIDDPNVFVVFGARHPYFVSLVQAYVAIAWGGWDDNIVNVPWLGVSVATFFTLFGGLRYLGSQLLPAMLACYAVVSLPMFDAHISLGSYADIWVGLAFLTSLFFLIIMLSHNDWRLAIMLFVFVLITYNAKHTALVFMVVLVVVLSWRLMSRVVMFMFATFLLIAVYLSRDWMNTELYKLLKPLLSSGVKQKVIEYNGVGDQVWLEWILLDNFHYVFIASLVSLVLLIMCGRQKHFRGFTLLLVASVTALCTMLVITFLSKKMTGIGFRGYFNRISLYFLFVFALIPVSVYELIKKDSDD